MIQQLNVRILLPLILIATGLALVAERSKILKILFEIVLGAAIVVGVWLGVEVVKLWLG